MFTCDKESLTDLQWVELEDKLPQIEAHAYSRPGDLHISGVKEDTCSMTDLGWEDLISMEMVYRKHMNALPYDNENGDGQRDLEHEDKECMTDLAWQELVELEESYRNNLKDLFPLDAADEHSMCKGERNTVDIETMTDLDFEELEEIESCYHRYLDEKGSVKSRDETETMTEIVWEELLQRTNSEVYLSLSEAINEKVTKRNFDVNEVGIMTDLELSELAKIEEKYLRYVEHESNINIQKEELVEVLPEIVLDTFPEDNIVNTKEEYAMTDLTWNDIINLQDNCYDYERNVQDLERKLATFKVQKDEKSSGTEMSFTDLAFDELIGLEAKCSGYKSVIKELEGKLAQYERNDARFNVGTKDAETMTDVSEDMIDNEGLPVAVLANFPSDIQTKDECDMTDVVWDEVVDLKNTYQDYRENLEEMKQKLAQFDVEKDDKESITDIAMQDLADLESMYKEHLREADSDTNSVLSHAEKESRECMTELTFIEITELEDFYIENAAREMAVSPIVEKWEQESITDITLDDMQYLEEAEYFVTRNSRAAEKLDKYTVTELTIHDLVSLQEIATRSELLQGVEKVEVATLTNLTIPDLEFLEDNYDVHQNCPVHAADTLRKEHIGVGTELTGEDLKYWEDVEAAHEECLLDKEGEEGCEEKQDAEIMTDLTIADLQYLEEVDAAHEECLLDKQEELKGKETIVERESIEIMTDMTISHLQYLEEVEAAHEECLVDKQEELEGKEAFAEKESVEIMTDMSISDLQYLEEVEAAHEECLVDRQEELKVKEAYVEKENVEIMTDMSISDLQHLEEVEAAHEECLVDRQEEIDGNEAIVEKESIEIMTDMSISDLQYLEEVEAAHEECLVDRQEEIDGNEAIVEKESIEIMTDMSISDLQYLEEVEAAHEECLVDRQEEIDGNEAIVEKESIEIMTDMGISDLQYLEEVEAAHEECLVNRQEEVDGNEAIVEKESIEIMTDMTISDLQYLEEVKAAYEECLVDKQEELERNEAPVERESIEIMTDMTISYLQYLEKESKAKTTDSEKLSVGTMTKMTKLDLRNLESIAFEKGKTKTPKPWKRRSRSSSLTDYHDYRYHHHHKNTMTEITGNILDYYEEIDVLYKENMVEFDELKRLHYVEKEEKDAMTDVTFEDLKDLEQKSLLWREKADEPAGGVAKDDAEVMTDLTTAELEYFEEAESLLRKISGENGGMAPKDEKEVLTDLKSSDIEYLQVLADIYDDGSRGVHVEVEAEKCDKETETELRLVDIRDLEDQVISEAAIKSTNAVKEAVNDDLVPETLVNLQAELDFLPILDEPEYIFDDEDNENDIQRAETGIMTEMTIANIRDLEDQRNSTTEVEAFEDDLQAEALEGLQTGVEYLPVLDEPGMVFEEEVNREHILRHDTGVMTELRLSHLENFDKDNLYRRDDGVELTRRVEASVQCDLEDVTSLMQELTREAENKGEDIPAWFVSALRLRQPEGGLLSVLYLLHVHVSDQFC